MRSLSILVIIYNCIDNQHLFGTGSLVPGGVFLLTNRLENDAFFLYNDIEVKMEPLIKAVYFLFLKHPEGITFKELTDYREELLEIYKGLKPMGLNKRTIQSIEDVTNPLLNSINEKCARIRAAFINKFDEHLAKNYFVTGERGEAKKISLPRDLVVWE